MLSAEETRTTEIQLTINVGVVNLAYQFWSVEQIAYDSSETNDKNKVILQSSKDRIQKFSLDVAI